MVDGETLLGAWHFWSFGVSIITMFVSILLFGRLTVARIERDICSNGLPRPCPWDGPGGRIFLYAYSIVLPSQVISRVSKHVIDGPLIKSYATHPDWVRALVLVVATLGTVVLAFID